MGYVRSCHAGNGALFRTGPALVCDAGAFAARPATESAINRDLYRMRKVFYLGNLHHKRQVCLVYARKTAVYERPILADRDNRCDQSGLTRQREALTARMGEHFPGSEVNPRQELRDRCANAFATSWNAATA